MIRENTSDFSPVGRSTSFRTWGRRRREWVCRWCQQLERRAWTFLWHFKRNLFNAEGQNLRNYSLSLLQRSCYWPHFQFLFHLLFCILVFDIVLRHSESGLQLLLLFFKTSKSYFSPSRLLGKVLLHFCCLNNWNCSPLCTDFNMYICILFEDKYI